MLAMDEVLRNVEGERFAVAVSICEVLQNHVYDLLDTDNKEVQILEDAQGKITLKGLSKVHVKSMAEFQKLYCGESRLKKPTKKIPLELPRRSHKVLMIHILASDEGENAECARKLNFLDLAGYETTGSNRVEGAENQPLNALLNVLYAINSSERVPFRESKVARIIQNDVGGTNNISMLLCQNPLFCQDTLHTINLASKLKNVKPATVSCSAKTPFNSLVLMSSDKTDPGASFSSTINKQTNPWYPLYAKKPSSSCAPLSANKPNPGVSTTKKHSIPRFPLSENRTNTVQKRRQPFGGVEQAKGIQEQALCMERKEISIMKPDGDTTDVRITMKSEISSGDFTVVPPHVKEEESPPLSAQIKEVRDGLKLFLSSIHSRGRLEAILDESEPETPVVTQKDGRKESPNVEAIVDESEPETPVVTQKDGRKEPNVENCLRFVNSASKDDLKSIWGIKEKRATYILKRREESLEPFKSLADLQDIGLRKNQVKKMMNSVAKRLRECCQ